MESRPSPSRERRFCPESGVSRTHSPGTLSEGEPEGEGDQGILSGDSAKLLRACSRPPFFRPLQRTLRPEKRLLSIGERPDAVLDCLMSALSFRNLRMLAFRLRTLLLLC
jgi:hypothetical protein